MAKFTVYSPDLGHTEADAIDIRAFTLCDAAEVYAKHHGSTGWAPKIAGGDALTVCVKGGKTLATFTVTRVIEPTYDAKLDRMDILEDAP